LLICHNMNNRAAPWNSKGPEGEKLLELFTKKLVDLDNLNKEYILQIQNKHSKVFGRFTPERFLVNYKKLLRAYKTGEDKKGARLRKWFVFICRCVSSI